MPTELLDLLRMIDSGKARAGRIGSGQAAELWQLVREGHGGLVGKEHGRVWILAAAAVDEEAFLALLEGLAAAPPLWATEEVQPALAGWSKALEAVLQALLATGSTVKLATAEVPEPFGSALRFALCRHGVAAPTPDAALPRIARAFLLARREWEEISKGLERVWPVETWARAVWGQLAEVRSISGADRLTPLVPFAAMDELWDARLRAGFTNAPDEWFRGRDAELRPVLERRVAALPHPLPDSLHGLDTLAVGALAQILARAGEPFPLRWTALVAQMVRHSAPGAAAAFASAPRVLQEAFVEMAITTMGRYEHTDLFRPDASPAVCAKLVRFARSQVGERLPKGRMHAVENLGRCGEHGQAGLRELLDHPELAHEVFLASVLKRGLRVDATNSLAALPLFSGPHGNYVAMLWGDLPRLERLALLDTHLEAIPDSYLFDLLKDLRPLPGYSALAARLPPRDEPWVAWLRAAPDPLPALTAAMSALPDSDRARAASTPDPSQLDFVEALWATAGRYQREADLDRLCARFAGEPGVGTVAVFWWWDGSASKLAPLAKHLGRELLEPLWRRAELGWYGEGGLGAIFAAFMDIDLLGSWPRLVARDRRVALRLLEDRPDPRLLPALATLEKDRGNRLSPADRRLVEGIRAKVEATGPARPRGDRALALRPIARMGAPIRRLLVAEGTCAVVMPEGVILRGEREVRLDLRGEIHLAPDGEWLVCDEVERASVYQPWASARRVRTIEPDEVIEALLALPGGRVITGSRSQQMSELVLWDVPAGKRLQHPNPDGPTALALCGNDRYLVGTTDGGLEVRAIDSGKRIKRMRPRGDELIEIVVGDGGRRAATRGSQGHVAFWRVGDEPAFLNDASGGAERWIAADRGRDHVATGWEGGVKLWAGGMQRQGLPGDGPGVFVAPGVLAVGGSRLDLWRLDGEHLGGLDQPFTALAAENGRLIAGDADGGLWELDLPLG